jgi:hypothetical protein
MRSPVQSCSTGSRIVTSNAWPAERARGVVVGDTGTARDDGIELYLDLLKRSVLNEVYLDDELRIAYLRRCLAGEASFDAAIFHDIRNGMKEDYEKLQAARAIGRFVDRKIRNAGFNHSMIGRARIENLHRCLDVLRSEDVPGDLVECGVWRGGACIFMAGYLRAHRMRGRRVFVADSFAGLPPPTLPEDAGLNLSAAIYPELAISLATVRANFEVYGLLDDQVVAFAPGWFKDTLSRLPTGKIALLRLDGDLYESTTDALTALYDRLAPGGIVIVDDYNGIAACKKAVIDFFARRGEVPPEPAPIDWTGVFWRV